MKSILFLISIFLVVGLSDAHAQAKRTRDVLFPDYAKDQIKLKAGALQTAKAPEAMITSAQQLRDMIFKSDNNVGGARTSAPVANTETTPLSSSKSVADAVKELKEQQAAAQAKIVMPKIEQGTEPQPKPKN